jgi:hypothetical protein
VSALLFLFLNCSQNTVQNHHDECVRIDLPSGQTTYAIPPINEELLPKIKSDSQDGIAADIPYLHSRPSATKKLFLNFDGCTAGSISGWGSNAYSPRYDRDGDFTSFSSGEIINIIEIFDRVAEDFVPFDIDVTTEPSPSIVGRQTLRVCIGGSYSLWYGSSAGGVAYIGSWSWSNNAVWVFPDNLGGGNPKYEAEAISHEAGHGFGLNHQAVGQQDLTILTYAHNEITYVADEHEGTIASATPMNISGTTVSQSGLIAPSADVDVFLFATGAGIIDLTANTFEPGPNLDIVLRLLNSAGNPIVTVNPANSLDTSLSVAVSAGTYYLEVSPAPGYAVMGQYTISGTIVAPSGGGDTTSLTASLTSAPSITSPGGVSYSFTVQYSDDVAIDESSNSAVYQFTPPGGSWSESDIGTYTISMGSSQVIDTSNNTVASAES